jgi:guanylate kinase
LISGVPDPASSPGTARHPGGDRTHRPLLIVLSGPSGVGKDAVLSRMRELKRPYRYVVTATTRVKRQGEQDGVDYHFLSPEQFQQMLDDGQFLEWANVYGNSYGVPKQEIASALAAGLDVIVKVDAQGAATIKGILPQAVFIFLMPPSSEAQEQRLRRRHSESATELALRLERAKEEMDRVPLFDYVVTSHQHKLNEVVFQVDAIVTAEKCRVQPRIVEL